MGSWQGQALFWQNPHQPRPGQVLNPDTPGLACSDDVRTTAGSWAPGTVHLSLGLPTSWTAMPGRTWRVALGHQSPPLGDPQLQAAICQLGSFPRATREGVFSGWPVSGTEGLRDGQLDVGSRGKAGSGRFSQDCLWRTREGERPEGHHQRRLGDLGWRVIVPASQCDPPPTYLWVRYSHT